MSGTLKDRLTVGNDTRHLLAVRDFISRMARHGGWSPEDVHKIVLAIDEAVTNIIEHGYGKDEKGTIELEADREQAGVVMEQLTRLGPLVDLDVSDADIEVIMRDLFLRRSTLGDLS